MKEIKNKTLCKWLNSMRETLESMQIHPDTDTEEKLGFIVEALEEAIQVIERNIEEEADQKEAAINYADIMRQNEQELYKLNRL